MSDYTIHMRELSGGTSRHALSQNLYEQKGLRAERHQPEADAHAKKSTSQKAASLKISETARSVAALSKRPAAHAVKPSSAPESLKKSEVIRKAVSQMRREIEDLMHSLGAGHIEATAIGEKVRDAIVSDAHRAAENYIPSDTGSMSAQAAQRVKMVIDSLKVEVNHDKVAAAETGAAIRDAVTVKAESISFVPDTAPAPTPAPAPEPKVVAEPAPMPTPAPETRRFYTESEATPLPGDKNGDGLVNSNDSEFETEEAPVIPGDRNADGVVNSKDSHDTEGEQTYLPGDKNMDGVVNSRDSEYSALVELIQEDTAENENGEYVTEYVMGVTVGFPGFPAADEADDTQRLDVLA